MPESIYQPIKTSQLLATPPLPDEWPDKLLSEIARLVQSEPSKVVVLDDDPTGTQTVHGLPVLTHWSAEALTAELRGPHRAFYILTNSRSMTAPEACRLNRQIGLNLKEAAARAEVPATVVSRSDSTLRGHFPAEVDALASAMGNRDVIYVIIPCFFEGGRYTLDDVHYVAEGKMLVPAAQTSYAKDAVFGYRHSNLRRWIEEKTAGRIPQEQVASVSLEDLRRGGPHRVTEIMAGLAPGSACVVNAVSYRDLEVFVLGLLEAEKRGTPFLCRTAASFVRVRCGIAPHDLIRADDLVGDNPNGGLFVVGSYVPKTTEQVNMLMATAGLTALEIDVNRLLDRCKRRSEVAPGGRCDECNDRCRWGCRTFHQPKTDHRHQRRRQSGYRPARFP